MKFKYIIILLCAVVIGSSTTYFPFLEVSPNAVNPGYTVYWNSVSSINFNPAVYLDRDGLNSQLLFSFGFLPLGYSYYGFNYLFKNIFFGFAGFFSEPFKDYIVDDFYDPQETDLILKPFSLYSLVGLSSVCSIFDLKPRVGFSGRFLYENDGVAKRSGISFNFGTELKTSFCKVGFSLQNIGFLFFKSNNYIPLSFSCGLSKDIYLSEKTRIALSLSAKTGIFELFSSLAGIHLFYEPVNTWTLGLLIDYALSFPSNEYNGLTPSLYVRYLPLKWKTELFFIYKLRWTFEIYHSFSLGFTFVI